MRPQLKQSKRNNLRRERFGYVNGFSSVRRNFLLENGHFHESGNAMRQPKHLPPLSWRNRAACIAFFMKNEKARKTTDGKWWPFITADWNSFHYFLDGFFQLPEVDCRRKKPSKRRPASNGRVSSSYSISTAEVSLRIWKSDALNKYWSAA